MKVPKKAVCDIGLDMVDFARVGKKLLKSFTSWVLRFLGLNPGSLNWPNLKSFGVLEFQVIRMRTARHCPVSTSSKYQKKILIRRFKVSKTEA